MNKPVFFVLLSILISGAAHATPFYDFPFYPISPETSKDSRHPVEHGGGGGVIVGNGGFTVRCSISGRYQSYDYLAAQAYFGSGFEVREVQSTSESIQRIRTLIAKKLPALAKSYDEFVSQLYNEDVSKHYIWKANQAPAYAGSNWIDMYNLNDGPISLLCPGEDISEVLFEQAVLRVPYPNEHGRQVLFYYDPRLTGSVYGSQWTFLLIHEWLWNYTDDLLVIIQADYLLHSTWIEKASSKEVIHVFKNLRIL